MRKDDLIRLRHMLDAAREAASKMTKEMRDEFPQIPWLSIISTRNRLIHAYFDINLDIVWKTVV